MSSAQLVLLVAHLVHPLNARYRGGCGSYAVAALSTTRLIRVPCLLVSQQTSEGNNLPCVLHRHLPHHSRDVLRAVPGAIVQTTKVSKKEVHGSTTTARQNQCRHADRCWLACVVSIAASRVALTTSVHAHMRESVAAYAQDPGNGRLES